jgi:UDP-N-acetylmuramyl pentapeptide phosphotransferase/UDP-N-acetylglucosamine-1-phosphate transferase
MLRCIAVRAGRIIVKWLILCFFLFGMISCRNWYEATAGEQKLAHGLMAIAAFALVVVLANTLL